ncbi:MAG TPA: ABC transporter ATP-binding protein [Dissulfurispiraceae bacterium]|nr:ABC transporter ATP-binding protein [Dissulfurispiraceae bacterium]
MIDASSRAAILNILLELRQRLGITIIFITHDIGMAYYTSDRLFIMHQGKIVEEGPADEIIRHPQHAYTQRLLADVPTLQREWIL